MSGRSREWTPFRALFLLRMEAVRLGRTPTMRDTRKPGKLCASESTYIKLFGSFAAAQAGARLVPNRRGGSKRRDVCRRGHDRVAENLDRQGHCKQCLKITRNRTETRRSA